MIDILVKVLLGIITVVLLIWLASYLGLLPAGLFEGFYSRNNQTEGQGSTDSTGSSNNQGSTQNRTGGQTGQSGSGSSAGGSGGQGGSAQQPAQGGDDKDTTIIDVDVVLPSAIPSIIPTPLPSIIPSSLPILN